VIADRLSVIELAIGLGPMPVSNRWLTVHAILKNKQVHTTHYIQHHYDHDIKFGYFKVKQVTTQFSMGFGKY